MSNAENHPLLRTQSLQTEETRLSDVKTKSANSSQANSGIIQVTTQWDGLDPLSLAALSSNSEPTITSAKLIDDDGILSIQKRTNFLDDDFTIWTIHRNKILNKFNTTEKLSIKSSFLLDKSGNQLKFNSNIIQQKVKERLDQLQDDFEETNMQEMSNLSQPEYVKRIEELNFALKDSWELDQKVKALKIAIQCSKQLSSTTVIHFYPSKFVLITDILDCFGNLVYNRLLNKSNERHEDSNISVQETCRNWFYKISSIRELLPRFYIEASILKIYSFLIDEQDRNNEFEKIFARLTRMIRGIGDPLVAIYCRLYLCRVAIDLYPKSKKIFFQNVQDIFESTNQLVSAIVQQTLAQQKVDFIVYYSLFVPALEWILNCLFYKSDNLVLDQVFLTFQKLYTTPIATANNNGSLALILNSLIIGYPSTFIIDHLPKFIEFIKHVGNGGQLLLAYPKYILVKNIADSLNSLENLFEFNVENKSLILEEIWTIIHGLSLTEEYVCCLEAWAEIIAKHYTVSDINYLLGDLVTFLLPKREFETYGPNLLTILSKIIQHGSCRFHFTKFFSLNNLMPYLDLFHKESLKIDACKCIVESFVKSFEQSTSTNRSVEDKIQSAETTSDPVILNLITYLCKIMHDSITALTLDDEKRQISYLISGFIRRINFNRDFEAQLNFYVESRSNFSNLDHVLGFLVYQVNLLAMETHQIVKGHHTKKTIAFVNACIAFSFITIPSIDDIIMRLQLYLSSSHVALVNVCLPQTDAFLKSAITLLRQLPPQSEGPDGKLYSNDEFLHSYVSQLLSTLIVVPVSIDA